MHREILASLADDDGRLPDGVPAWLAGVGAVVGEAAVEAVAAVRRVGRGLAGLFGQLAAEVELAVREVAREGAREGAPARPTLAERGLAADEGAARGETARALPDARPAAAAVAGD
jgi:hypothetical protein